jgi:hypothetical protein
MLKFHKNKSQTFKCRVEIQGADNPKITPRLILSPNNSNVNMFFEGKYDNKQCEITISSTANIASKGNVILEIIANDTVFRPWKSTYEIVSEQMVVENIELVNTKNNISVKLVETIKEDNDDKYVNFLNKIPKNKRKKFLEYLKNSYKPKSTLLEWSKKEFNENKSLKAKVAMYYKQNEAKLIKEDTKSKFPEIEEWDKNKIGSYYHWKVISKKRWNNKKAIDFQESLGYSENPYGFYNFNIKKNIDGTFTITWECASSS